MRNVNIMRCLRHQARIQIKYARRPRRYRQVLRAVARLRPRSILEVGVFQGRRGVEMIEAAALSRPVEEIEYFGFDLFEKMTSDVMRVELSKWPNPIAEVTARLEATGATIELHAGFTQDTLAAFLATNPGRRIDFIFLDGGHAVETIHSDWSYLHQLMHSKTVVVLDDYYVDCPHLTDEFGCNGVVGSLDRNQFDWHVLSDVDRFVHDGKPHNVAMAEVTYRETDPIT